MFKGEGCLSEIELNLSRKLTLIRYRSKEDEQITGNVVTLAGKDIVIKPSQNFFKKDFLSNSVCHKYSMKRKL